jgi:enoyl-[acyl-carrier protein] reductase I
MVTLTYGGSTKVMPNYNVMGVAKAALESWSATWPPITAAEHPRQRDLGRSGAHAGRFGRLRRAPDVQLPEAQLAARAHRFPLEEIGGSALYLLSDLSGGVTGEVHFVDSGYNIMSMPRLDELKAQETGRGPRDILRARDAAGRSPHRPGDDRASHSTVSSG